jgi:hypothetical protein
MPQPYRDYPLLQRADGAVRARARGEIDLTRSEGDGIGRLIDGTRAVLRRALALLGSPQNLPDGTDRLFELLFLTPIERQAYQRVHARLETTSTCLHNQLTLKVIDVGRRVGYVRGYLDPQTKKPNPSKQRTEGTKLGVQVYRGDIHIDRSLLTAENLDMGIVTLIHEATHKFASTEDHGTAGYFNEDCYAGYRAPGLTSAQALNNADSHAFFAFLLAEMEAGRVRCR